MPSAPSESFGNDSDVDAALAFDREAVEPSLEAVVLPGAGASMEVVRVVSRFYTLCSSEYTSAYHCHG